MNDHHRETVHWPVLTCQRFRLSGDSSLVGSPTQHNVTVRGTTPVTSSTGGKLAMALPDISVPRRHRREALFIFVPALIPLYRTISRHIHYLVQLLKPCEGTQPSCEQPANTQLLPHLHDHTRIRKPDVLRTSIPSTAQSALPRPSVIQNNVS